MITEASSFSTGDANDRVLLINATTKATSLETSVTSGEIAHLARHWWNPIATE